MNLENAQDFTRATMKNQVQVSQRTHTNAEFQSLEENGGRTRTRTGDPLIMSASVWEVLRIIFSCFHGASMD